MDTEKLFGSPGSHVVAIQLFDERVSYLLSFQLGAHFTKVKNVVQICNLSGGMVALHTFDHAVHEATLMNELEEEIPHSVQFRKIELYNSVFIPLEGAESLFYCINKAGSDLHFIVLVYVSHCELFPFCSLISYFIPFPAIHKRIIRSALSDSLRTQPR